VASFLNIVERLPFTPRDYQRAALEYALDANRCIILSPTGSGKSFIIYLLQQYFQVPTLIVVPTLGLISQMENDFRSYGCQEAIQTIQGGTTKEVQGRLTISTWQSIYQLPEAYFATFGCIVVDEVHTAKSKSVTDLMKKCTTTPYRFGFTGTMDHTECHRLVLEGLFGSIKRVASTHDLVQRKQLAPLRIKYCVLEHPPAVRKLLRRVSYEEEVDYLIKDASRNEFIAQLVVNTEGNTLVLFQFLEHGQRLLNRLYALAATYGKQVHYIAGSVDAVDREQIRRVLETGDNHILAGTFGTMQLGINCPNLRNLVFAHPAKSPIRVLQSIGRILRLASGKTQATLIDLADDLRLGKVVNHLWHHAQDRTDYYAAEQFPMTIKQVDMTRFARMVPQTAQEPLGAFQVETGAAT
jgi:superfamily II DNA or RNA helicase